MNKLEQKTFIAELTRSVTAEMYKAIQDGKVPTTWDGHELRRWLAEKFASANYTKAVNGNNARTRAYKQTCVETGISCW